MWSRPNTLWRLSQKSSYNSRVLERGSIMRTLMRGGCWGFYSSEVLPPFLVEQVFSLYDKSFPCGTSLVLAAQVLSLQSKSSGIWNVVDKSGPSFCWGLHTKNGLGLLSAHGHGPVGLAKPYLIFYRLQLPFSPHLVRRFCANGQLGWRSKQSWRFYVHGATDKHTWTVTKKN